MYWSERIGVVAISNNKNNREIEAIPGLFRLNVGWSAHFFLGRPTFLLPVGLISVTNLGMRVSFVLNTVSWASAGRGGLGLLQTQQKALDTKITKRKCIDLSHWTG